MNKTRDLFENEQGEAGTLFSEDCRPSTNLPGSVTSKEQYTASHIEILEGLEPVRRRPGMYIGGTDEKALHHLFSEVIDNAVDEAVAGHATRIRITLAPDGSITVQDNGRGIPVDPHPKFKNQSALEVLMTTLHSGSKFDSDAYITPGGLHGVGISVVNALSVELTVEVAREQQVYVQRFSRGIPVTSLELGGKVKNRRGTSIHFLPDPEIFGENCRFDPKRLFQIARSKAYLCAGLEILWFCAKELLEKNGSVPEEASFRFPGGLRDFLRSELKENPLITEEPFAGKIIHPKTLETVEWAVSWLDDGNGFTYSYCNTVPTPQGGTHEAALRSVFLNGLRNYGNLIGEKRISQVTGEDILSSVAIMLSLFLREPEFQGQTKEKLTSKSATRVVEQALRDPFDHWLLNNQAQSRQLLDRILEQAEERIRKKRDKNVSRKSATQRLRLPGKLIDCSRQESEGTEIFIVEGDSAGGSAKMARDRTTQAILPIRGKILNVASAGGEKIESNQQINDLLLALGCGVKSDYAESTLRYERVIIMTDADVDGAHIASLLITFFFREIPQLIRNGHLYLAAPPLYRLTYAGETYYAHSDSQKEEILATLSKKSRKVEIGRFKGLGEMTAKQLKETTMLPEKRSLFQVVLAEDQEENTASCVEHLMGSKVEYRFSFIQKHASFTGEETLDL